MRETARSYYAALICLIAMLAPVAAIANDAWVVTQDIPLTSRWPGGGKLHEDKITADLFRPKGAGKLPAAVIINSSGGVLPHHELFYARLLASNGIAALAVDSFMSRGVRQTTDDQSRVWQEQSDADAAAGFRWLAAQPWVDPKRILVIGMSRGGEAAIHAALVLHRISLSMTDTLFAAHVAITPGGCNEQDQDPRTTGAPILFMLAELDDETPIQPCLEYIQRIRAAGNPNVRLAVYLGVYHAYNFTGGIAETIDDDYRRCSFFWKNPTTWIDRVQGKEVPASHDYLMTTCVDRGKPHTVGGDRRIEAQASADLLQFLRDVGVIDDATARAVVPDCDTILAGIHRRNCVRARDGWTGDLVALARLYRDPTGPMRNSELAARLFRLAADRGDARGQWELALMLQQGEGIARDLPTALSLLKASAAAGQPPAMNILGVAARDGVGEPRNDTDAVNWFRQAAELRDDYALANLGEMYWNGRGGLKVDHVQAVHLWHKSAYYDNPWGRLWLAEALERGDGTPSDITEALAQYRSVAAQNREPAAQKRAAAAIARLRR